MKQQLPLITIIVGIYNGEKFLSECIESVINQAYENLEIILVNDGSTDNSIGIIECPKSKPLEQSRLNRSRRTTSQFKWGKPYHA